MISGLLDLSKDSIDGTTINRHGTFGMRFIALILIAPIPAVVDEDDVVARLFCG